VRLAEILDIDLQVVAVELGQLLVGLAEDQLLMGADLDMRRLAVAVLLDAGDGAEHLAIERAIPLAVPSGTVNSTYEYRD